MPEMKKATTSTAVIAHQMPSGLNSSGRISTAAEGFAFVISVVFLLVNAGKYGYFRTKA